MARVQDNELEKGQEEGSVAIDAPGSSGQRLLFVSPRHPATPSLHSQLSRSDYVLDWIERFLVLCLYGWLVFRLVNNSIREGILINLLFLPSNGMVVFFLLTRRQAVSMTRHASDWVIALLGSCIGLLVVPAPVHSLVWAQLAAPLLLGGFFLQILSKIALGRSFGCVPAHRGLKLSGPYRLVRHPMYAGYCLSHLAFLAVNPCLWNAGIFTLEIAFQLYRLRAEERILCQDPAYVHYRRKVRYRLVPGLF